MVRFSTDRYLAAFQLTARKRLEPSMRAFVRSPVPRAGAPSKCPSTNLATQAIVHATFKFPPTSPELWRSSCRTLPTFLNIVRLADSLRPHHQLKAIPDTHRSRTLDSHFQASFPVEFTLFSAILCVSLLTDSAAQYQPTLNLQN